MNLVKEIRTSTQLIKIYSINPNLTVGDDLSRFEDKDDFEIRDIVFNELGAEQVDIYDIINGQMLNLRSYAIL